MPSEADPTIVTLLDMDTRNMAIKEGNVGPVQGPNLEGDDLMVDEDVVGAVSLIK